MLDEMSAAGITPMAPTSSSADKDSGTVAQPKKEPRPLPDENATGGANASADPMADESKRLEALDKC